MKSHASTISHTIPNGSLLFLEAWANFFSKRVGTALFYTGTVEKSAPDARSILFLCPSSTFTSYDYQSVNLISCPLDYPWFGVLSYDMAAARLTSYSTDARKTLDPLYTFFSPTIWAIFSHTTSSIEIFYKEEQLSKIHTFFDDRRLLNDVFLHGKLPQEYISEKLPYKHPQIVSWESCESFIDKIEKIKQYIHDGDIYQLNISYEVAMTYSQEAYTLFRKLIQNNPSPESVFIRLDTDSAIASSSPERLLKRLNNRLYSKPIKGTRRRGVDPIEDQRLREELIHSIKEHSELAMITDLMRHDLFSISMPGTIQVDSCFEIAAYESVFQQYATLSSTPKEEKCPLEIIQMISPGGSITGCPKIRAVQRIHEIEKRYRGIYTGSIGYALSSDDFDWNIAIRTILIHEKNEEARFSVGSGIVWQSLPKDEYEETLHKAKSLLRAIESI